MSEDNQVRALAASSCVLMLSPPLITRRMQSMMQEVERSFFEPFGMAGGFGPPSFDMPLSRMSRSSAGVSLDVRETDKGFELAADLPGMRKEDISVDVDRSSNVLTVSGERKHEREESDGGRGGERRSVVGSRSTSCFPGLGFVATPVGRTRTRTASRFLNT